MSVRMKLVMIVAFICGIVSNTFGWVLMWYGDTGTAIWFFMLAGIPIFLDVCVRNLHARR